MKLCFDSIEEVKTFVGSLKGTRGKKGEGDEGGEPIGQVPAPLMPPPNQFNMANASAAFTPPQGFPGQPVADPVVTGLVERIIKRIDGAIASGQSADAALTWFRGQCGAEASAATMDQIKTVFLPKLAVPGLENIAKLMKA